MIERLNIDGIVYELQYDISLTQEQRIQTIDEIRRQVAGGCGGCGKKLNSPNSIAKLTKTCSVTSKVSGQTINLIYTPNGTGPFTVDFYRKQGTGTKIQTGIVNAHQTNIATGANVSGSYPVSSTDNGNWDFWAEGLDVCGNVCGTSDVCTITLNPPTTTTTPPPVTTTTTPPPATTTTTPPPATTTTTPPPKSITVTSPTAGVAWQAGTTHDIQWSYTGSISTVNIHLWKGGIDVGTGTASVNASNLVWSWPILSSRPYGTDYRIRITDNADATVFGESPNFTITNLASIAVNCPVSGCNVSPTGTLQMSAVCTNLQGTTFTCPTLQWNSSDTTKATVNITTGLVTGVAAGTARITATDMITGVSGFRDITVVPAICIWVTANGGNSAMTPAKIFVLIDQYTGINRTLTFTPTVREIFGVIDYYVYPATPSIGNGETGCTF